jgi:nitrate reductase gamma subunit
MEATREIYWNVGHGVILPMYFFAFLAIAIFLYGFYRRLATYKLGKTLNRLDRLPERIFLLLKNTFAQVQVLRVFGPGSLHALFFWGFGLLFIGTLLIMAQVDFTQPIFDWMFLKGSFYKLFSLVLDVAGFVALVMLGGLLVRRFFVKPEGLETILDDYVVHSLLFAILLTGFVVEGLRIADTELMTNPGLTLFSPVGTLFGKIFFLVMTADALSRAHTILWWVHFFLSMGFIVIIPFTKLRHIFTTSTNYLFTDLSARGSIATINLEDEGVKQFGAAKVSDLAWKDIFDADACTTCKRCQERCPAYATGKPLSPMKVVKQIGEVAFTNPREV